MITFDFLSRILKSQPAQEDFIPKISQHVTPEIYIFKEKRIGFTIRFEGTPFEGINDQVVVNQFLHLNQVLSILGKELGDRLALWCTLHRRKIDFNRNYRFRNVFTKEFAKKYMERFQKDDYYENLFYISVILNYEDLDDAIAEADDLKEKMLENLKVYDPVILKVYENHHNVLFSEAYEFFGTITNAGIEKIPLSNKDAYTIIPSADLHFGAELLEIRTAERTRYATMYDLKDFGITKLKILNPILSLPTEFIFTQSFTYISQSAMQNKIDHQLNKLLSVGDLAVFQQQEMIEAKGLLSAGELMFGDFHAALVVFADTPKKAAKNGQMATAQFLNSGGYRFVRSTLSAPITYFSQMPGASIKPRPFPKSTVNLATTFGMYNYSHGKTRGNPLGDGWAVDKIKDLV